MCPVSRHIQVTAPRGPFPHAGSASPGWATTTYTQTTPLRAEVVPGAAWSRRRTRDRRPHRSKQGLLCTRAQDCAAGGGGGGAGDGNDDYDDNAAFVPMAPDGIANQPWTCEHSGLPSGGCAHFASATLIAQKTNEPEAGVIPVRKVALACRDKRQETIRDGEKLEPEIQ